ncbi:MAG: JmjC domain-containing protein [Bdellovibrionales bacterium]
MILHKTQQYNSGVSELVSMFYDWLYMKSSVSTVFTLRGEKTLKWHWDTNDFFVLQIEGKKKWDIYESVTRYPVSVDINPIAGMPGKSNSKLLKSIILEKGDMLYLPGGFPHNVTSVSDADSLHLTFSLDTITWYELIKKIHKKIIHKNISDINFRIPIWQLLSGEVKNNDKEYYKKLQKKILNQFANIDLSEAFDDMMAERELISPIDLQKSWSSLFLQKEISSQTQFERTNLKIRLEKYDDFLRVQVGTSILLFDILALPAIEFVSKNQKFTVKDIPKLKSNKLKIEIAKILMENAAIIFSEN